MLDYEYGGYGKGDLGAVDEVAASILARGGAASVEAYEAYVSRKNKMADPVARVAIEHPEITDPYAAVEGE